MKIFPPRRSFAHDRRDLLRVGALDQLTDRKSEVARAVMRHGRVQRHVQLHALATRRLRAHLERQVVEQVADEQPDLRALDDRRGRARIEIEHDRARRLDVLCPRHRRVQLERRHVAGPHERRRARRSRSTGSCPCRRPDHRRSAPTAVGASDTASRRTTCASTPFGNRLKVSARSLGCAAASPARCARSSR